MGVLRGRVKSDRNAQASSLSVVVGPRNQIKGAKSMTWRLSAIHAAPAQLPVGSTVEAVGSVDWRGRHNHIDALNSSVDRRVGWVERQSHREPA